MPSFSIKKIDQNLTWVVISQIKAKDQLVALSNCKVMLTIAGILLLKINETARTLTKASQFSRSLITPALTT
jgi:hypothetical protein